MRRAATSAREQQIVRPAALGRSSKEIAAALAIAPKTVANHLHRIGRKLADGDVVDPTRYARSPRAGSSKMPELAREAFRARSLTCTYDWESWASGRRARRAGSTAVVERTTGYAVAECLALADCPPGARSLPTIAALREAPRARTRATTSSFASSAAKGRSPGGAR
ncbi:MAG: helix-turn-helix transcriptional regulator [Proteobacteria bacterium]|nr:helix-turn-helix transcriptional regulator [Pseudomonadota bacterium]